MPEDSHRERHEKYNPISACASADCSGAVKKKSPCMSTCSRAQWPSAKSRGRRSVPVSLHVEYEPIPADARQHGKQHPSQVRRQSSELKRPPVLLSRGFSSFLTPYSAIASTSLGPSMKEAHQAVKGVWWAERRGRRQAWLRHDLRLLNRFLQALVIGIHGAADKESDDQCGDSKQQ